MRYRSLDAVRGIAAVAVLLHHGVMTFPSGGEDRRALLEHGFRAPTAWLYASPLRLAVSGPAAVLLFFVLSGFVLSLSLRSDRAPSYPAFAVSRVCRIWLPFAVAIFASVLLSGFLAAWPAPGTSDWFRFGTWHNARSFGNVVRHLAMTGTETDLDNPMWSLIHELRISFIFPVLVFVVMRRPVGALLGSVILCFACILVVGGSHLPSHMISWFQTGTYVYFFVLGILLAAHAERVTAAFALLSRRTILLLWVLALGALAIAPPDTSHIATFGNGALLIVGGLAGATIIALSISGGTAERFLLGFVPRYLGRISYSLYLTHIIVLASVVHLLAGAWSLPVALAIAVPLAIVVADLCQRFVEGPSQRLGKLGAMFIDSAPFLSNRRWKRADPSFDVKS
jgi:peptidoglycan/LPS O-acetylase OafA/YrhL